MAAGAEHWLSDIRGRTIAAADGTPLGRVVDLALAPRYRPPAVRSGV